MSVAIGTCTLITSRVIRTLFFCQLFIKTPASVWSCSKLLKQDFVLDKVTKTWIIFQDTHKTPRTLSARSCSGTHPACLHKIAVFLLTVSRYSIAKRFACTGLCSVQTVHTPSRSIIFREHSGQRKESPAFEEVLLCQITALTESAFQQSIVD